MSFDKESLFKLLPAFDRIRDHAIANTSPDGNQDGPLKALLGLIAEQMAVLEENLDQLYDDQFIETCAEWVVPYIGDLVGTRGLVVFPDAPFSQREQVANTISYRRRKGTAAVLEQLTRDVTGWTANVVEYFEHLATTQYMNHLRKDNLSMANLKNWEQMEYVNTPFDKLARTADVRRIESKRGKYNIPNIGLFLWRLDAFSSLESPAFKVDDRRYKFDALGKDTALYNMPQAETEISHLADPVNVPMPIRRLILKNYLDTYYGKGKSLIIYRGGIPVVAADLTTILTICNLSDKTDNTGDWYNMPTDKIAIDPVLGRIAFPSSQVTEPVDVHVNYHYGFSDKMGGGDYERTATFANAPDPVIKLQVPADQPSIQDALNALSSTGGIVEITNNEYFIETPVLHLPEGKHVELRAAEGKRPILVLDGDCLITGGASAEVFINGLLISGGCLRVPAATSTGALNQLEQLTLTHCTLAPGSSAGIQSVAAQSRQPRLIVESSGVRVSINRCITGSIRTNEDASVSIKNSIVDAFDEATTAYGGLNSKYGAPLNIENCTVIGKLATRIMELASNTIFYTGLNWIAGDPPPVEAQRLQEGCVRFCYVPPGSRIPRPYHCQPATPEDSARVRPLFNALTYGQAAYCQLSEHCAVEIRQGGDNQSEIGAFNRLYQPQRETNLRTRLSEYLRFGLEAGIFYGS